MYYFCTLFDQNYLARGLALYESLDQNCPAFTLWVLCMDKVSYQILTKLALPHLRLITLDDFEQGDTALFEAKQNRSRVEYYFTCTPSLPLFILNHFSKVDLITYLDADLYFFADPISIYEEIGNRSVAIIEHRYSPHLEWLVKHGIYNVGWLSFRRDQQGLTCLEWWRERCLEWCYDRAEEGRYGDQKYLDDWPTRFTGVVVLKHKGANLAPWNLCNYQYHWVDDQVWVDEQPLVFFHFQAFKQFNAWLYDPGFAWVGYRKPSKVVVQQVYAPYIRILRSLENKIRPVVIEFDILKTIRADPKHSTRKSRMPQAVDNIKSILRTIKYILTHNYLVEINGNIL